MERPERASERTVSELIDPPPRTSGRLRVAADPYDALPPEALGMIFREMLEGASEPGALFAEWIRAGADVLLAPTLCATPAGLRPLGLAHRSAELNRAALCLLRQAADAAATPCEVAAQVGPLGPQWAQEGFFPFDEAYIHYHEQAKGLALGRPDLVVVRRIASLRLLKAALVALRELWSGPVVVLLEPSRLPAGAGPGMAHPLERAAEMVASLDIGRMGVEGVVEPAALEEAAGYLRRQGFTSLAAAFSSASGPLPRRECLARASVELVLLQGKDGLEALRAFAGEATPPLLAPAAAGKHAGPAAARTLLRRRVQVALETDWEEESGTKRQPAGPAIPAEHVTHTGVSILAHTEGLAAGGVRRRKLEERVFAVEAGGHRPLALVVRDPLVLETGLKAAAGRSIAYLDCADPGLWESVFYLACKYGAKLALRLAPERVRDGERPGEICIPAIQRLFEAAREYSRIEPDDIYVDPLGSGSEGRPAWDRETTDLILREMPWAKRETGVRWILNCRHFLDEAASCPPEALQSETLSIALFQGLDAVILGADQPHLLAALRAHHGWDERP